jgi:hypothetical protein
MIRVPSASLLILTVSIGLGGCRAATAPRETIFGDRFGLNALDSYAAYSDSGFPWSAGSGVMRGDGIGLQSVLIRKDVRFTDGWIDVLVDSVDDGGLVLRFADNEHYYLLAIRDDESPPPRNSDNLQIYRRSGPGQAGFTSIWRRNVDWPRGLARRVRFEAAGDRLLVYLDGEPMGDVVVDASSPNGEGIGMRHYGNSAGWISRYRELRWLGTRDR